MVLVAWYAIPALLAAWLETEYPMDQLVVPLEPRRHHSIQASSANSPPE
jgi:hypothetical protein